MEIWRWEGVPLFLRTGKRLAGRIAEIVVNFWPVQHSALEAMALRPGSNRLTIRLQPNESIQLSALAKPPSMGMTLQGVHLDLAFDQFFKQDRMEAYQRLLLDVIPDGSRSWPYRDASSPSESRPKRSMQFHLG